MSLDFPKHWIKQYGNPHMIEMPRHWVSDNPSHKDRFVPVKA